MASGKSKGQDKKDIAKAGPLDGVRKASQKPAGGVGKGKEPGAGAVSNTLKAHADKRRTVFKPVIDDPYVKIEWPAVSDADTMADLLESLLQPIGSYVESSKARTKSEPQPEAPTVSDWVTLGFNSTNAAVEDYTSSRFRGDSLASPLPPVVAVFVCRSDYTSALVTAHFPLLCAAASLSDQGEGTEEIPTVKLIQLPKGTAFRLSRASGKPDLLVVGVRTGAPGCQVLLDLVNKIEAVQVPWLANVFRRPNIKMVKTSAPAKGK